MPLRVVFIETVTNYDEFGPGLLIDIFIIDCKSQLAVVSCMAKETVMTTIIFLHPGPINVHKNENKTHPLLLKCFHCSIAMI